MATTAPSSANEPNLDVQSTSIEPQFDATTAPLAGPTVTGMEPQTTSSEGAVLWPAFEANPNVPEVPDVPDDAVIIVEHPDGSADVGIDTARLPKHPEFRHGRRRSQLTIDILAAESAALEALRRQQAEIFRTTVLRRRRILFMVLLVADVAFFGASMIYQLLTGGLSSMRRKGLTLKSQSGWMWWLDPKDLTLEEMSLSLIVDIIGCAAGMQDKTYLLGLFMILQTIGTVLVSLRGFSLFLLTRVVQLAAAAALRSAVYRYLTLILPEGDVAHLESMFIGFRSYLTTMSGFCAVLCGRDGAATASLPTASHPPSRSRTADLEGGTRGATESGLRSAAGSILTGAAPTAPAAAPVAAGTAPVAAGTAPVAAGTATAETELAAAAAAVGGALAAAQAPQPLSVERGQGLEGREGRSGVALSASTPSAVGGQQQQQQQQPGGAIPGISLGLRPWSATASGSGGPPHPHPHPVPLPQPGLVPAAVGSSQLLGSLATGTALLQPATGSVSGPLGGVAPPVAAPSGVQLVAGPAAHVQAGTAPVGADAGAGAPPAVTVAAPLAAVPSVSLTAQQIQRLQQQLLLVQYRQRLRQFQLHGGQQGQQQQEGTGSGRQPLPPPPHPALPQRAVPQPQPPQPPQSAQQPQPAHQGRIEQLQRQLRNLQQQQQRQGQQQQQQPATAQPTAHRALQPGGAEVAAPAPGGLGSTAAAVATSALAAPQPRPDALRIEVEGRMGFPPPLPPPRRGLWDRSVYQMHNMRRAVFRRRGSPRAHDPGSRKAAPEGPPAASRLPGLLLGLSLGRSRSLARHVAPIATQPSTSAAVAAAAEVAPAMTQAPEFAAPPPQPWSLLSSNYSQLPPQRRSLEGSNQHSVSQQPLGHHCHLQQPQPQPQQLLLQPPPAAATQLPGAQGARPLVLGGIAYSGVLDNPVYGSGLPGGRGATPDGRHGGPAGPQVTATSAATRTPAAPADGDQAPQGRTPHAVAEAVRDGPPADGSGPVQGQQRRREGLRLETPATSWGSGGGAAAGGSAAPLAGELFASRPEVQPFQPHPPEPGRPQLPKPEMLQQQLHERLQQLLRQNEALLQGRHQDAAGAGAGAALGPAGSHQPPHESAAGGKGAFGAGGAQCSSTSPSPSPSASQLTLASIQAAVVETQRLMEALRALAEDNNSMQPHSTQQPAPAPTLLTSHSQPQPRQPRASTQPLDAAPAVGPESMPEGAVAAARAAAAAFSPTSRRRSAEAADARLSGAVADAAPAPAPAPAPALAHGELRPQSQSQFHEESRVAGLAATVTAPLSTAAVGGCGVIGTGRVTAAARGVGAPGAEVAPPLRRPHVATAAAGAGEYGNDGSGYSPGFGAAAPAPSPRRAPAQLASHPIRFPVAAAADEWIAGSAALEMRTTAVEQRQAAAATQHPPPAVRAAAAHGRPAPHRIRDQSQHQREHSARHGAPSAARPEAGRHGSAGVESGRGLRVRVSGGASVAALGAAQGPEPGGGGEGPAAGLRLTVDMIDQLSPGRR